MHCKAEQPFFVIQPPVLNAFADVQKQRRLFGIGIVWKDVDGASLRRHEISVAAITRVCESHRAQSHDASVVVGTFKAFPLQIGECHYAFQRQLSVQWISHASVFRQFTQLDISKRNHVAVILQTDMAFGGFSELRKRSKLARRNAFIPFFVTLKKVVIADTIDGHFTLTRRDAQVDVIPFSDRASRVVHVSAFEADLVFEHGRPFRLYRLVQLIEPAGLLRIVTIDIVLNLNFRTAVPRCRLIFCHMKHETAVASFGNTILERQFKVLILLGADDIAGVLLSSFESAVLHRPAVA